MKQSCHERDNLVLSIVICHSGSGNTSTNDLSHAEKTSLTILTTEFRLDQKQNLLSLQECWCRQISEGQISSPVSNSRFRVLTTWGILTPAIKRGRSSFRVRNSAQHHNVGLW
eukprot:Lithocolla_globosa_v1_NODE_772_length_3299_cov_35.787916.p4 type:complete len:113 gc:universal NODE_772_length_3299_cov_35.787916:670-1008(+)